MSLAAVLNEPAVLEAEELDDVTWLSRVRAGDEEASRALVRRLYPTVIRLVRSHLPRRSSEEDLAQAVMIKIFHKLDQFSGQVPLEHWVSRVTINTCLNQVQREKVRPELRLSDLSPEEQAVVYNLNATEDDLAEDEAASARELLDAVLGQLKPDHRLVIRLLHLEERSVEEVSRLTGWSVSCVKVKAFRARHRLRRLLSALVASGRW